MAEREGIAVNSTVIAISGGLGALVASSIIRIYFGPLIEYFAAKTLGRVVRGNRYDVRGTWKSTYNYPSRGRAKRTTQLMRLSQIGPTVYGKNIGGNSPHKHSMILKLDGPYLTGTWRNMMSGAGHHGAVQFRIRADGTEMHGKWVGFDGDSIVQGDVWTMTRQ